ncbi:MAG: sulfatase-like hydrolase/transferase [Gammaproteobacteria bacterium]
MNRREFLSGLAPAFNAQTKSNPAQPNVILILTDDQGYGDLSCHGNPVLKTPNFDRLHSQSVRFTDFHSGPMCSPTRGQLMTGLDALRNGATFPATERSRLQRGIPTMADAFATNRYATGIFGKWHLGDNYPYRPMERGFQTAKYHLSYGLSSSSDFDNDYFDGRYVDNAMGVGSIFESVS